MNDFEINLARIGEVGEVTQLHSSIVLISGLPGAVIGETVYFENGAFGQVVSINEHVEIMLLSACMVRVGERVARTNKPFTITLGKGLLGRIVDPLLIPRDDGLRLKNFSESRLVDVAPSGIVNRRVIDKPLVTGVTLVDLVVPLGKGQRELVIGDRKTGKSTILLQTVATQAREGMICIYGLIGKKQSEQNELFNQFKALGIDKQIVMVSSFASDPSGMVVVAPFVAMTIAEYFRDQGRDVLLILDDMTTHARFYRETALLAKRFPGRNSYPGDVFYTQARLLERAGNFENGSISCLPVAETVMGEIAGYIQTNLMAITDGHIYFDKTLFNQGRRPAINPYLSVTRVGYQAQTTLIRDVSRELSRFLSHYKKMQEFLHFGAELSEDIQKTLGQGDAIQKLFDQQSQVTVPLSVSVTLLGAIWVGIFKDVTSDQLPVNFKTFFNHYHTDQTFKKTIDTLVSTSKLFSELVLKVKERKELFV